MKLIISHLLSHRQCVSLRMTGEAKPSEENSTDCKIIVSMIPVY